MTALHLHREDEPEPTFRFPAERVRQREVQSDAMPDPLAALDTVDRRIDHLARELNCPSHFDDGDDDRPRAA